MPRTYERKFDWDEARALASEGVPHTQIARKMGVSASAIKRVVDPEHYQYDRRRSDAWRRGGTCPECGAQTTRTDRDQSRLCIPCFAKSRITSVRDGELQCVTCREWKADEDFPSNAHKSNAVRRGRHQQCRTCQTVARRNHRQRNREADNAYQREYHRRKRQSEEAAK